MKPILFNTEMVRAIQADRKTVTRRVVKPPVMNTIVTPPLQPANSPGMWAFYGEDRRRRVPYRPGDILYVRETWNYGYCDTTDFEFQCNEIFFEELTLGTQKDSFLMPRYFYKTEDLDGIVGMKWRPSIHMPREAARIFLRVTDVRVQQLKDVTEADARAEGFYTRAVLIMAILKMYPDCTEESWMWVIEFERISREEACYE